MSDKPKCSCDTCVRGREIDRIASLLPEADAASLHEIHNRLLDDEESADREICKLREKLEALERGEFICKKCGLRKDGEGERGDF